VLSGTQEIEKNEVSLKKSQAVMTWGQLNTQTKCQHPLAHAEALYLLWNTSKKRG
jgi:hypothetical protein